ncbi:MAG TPA: ABC transporter substrate-binding protein, partial [Steroidobacteraceae bacterium]|nr:ABC transporter substrate-binding protein [Steroidobacteraceae bacterium]
MRGAARALVISLLALAALCGCSRSPSGGSKGGAPRRAAILLRGLGSEPDSLDPQKARADEAQRVLRDVCEGLTTVARTGGVAPGIADKWQVSSDGKTYTFTLRQNARWSNGQPVVGADFVAGLRRLVDPETASQYAEVVDVIA